MALGAVLAGEAEVALRQADLPQGVEVAEGHPQEALVDLQEVLLPGEAEEHPELLASGVGLQTSGGEGRCRRSDPDPDVSLRGQRSAPAPKVSARPRVKAQRSPQTQ